MAGNQREMQRKERRENKEHRHKLIIWIGIGVLIAILAIMKICEININSVKDYFTDEEGNFSITDGVSNDNYPYSIDASQNVNLINYDNRVGVLTPNSFTALNSKEANAEAFFEHGYSNPIIQTKGGYTLVYDQGAKNYRLDELNGAIYEEDCDNSILCADVASNGTVAIATTSSEKLCDIRVYSKSLNLKFETSISSGFVVDTAISDNAKQIAIAAVNSSNAQLLTTVYIYNVNSDGSDYKEFVLPSSTLLDISFVGSSLWVVGSDYAGIISGKDYKEVYAQGTINTKCYSYNQAEELVIAYGNYSNSTEYVVAYIKSNGKVKTEINVNAVVKDIFASTSVISVLTTDEIINFNPKNGNEKSRLQTSDSVRSICVIGSEIYVHKQSIIDKGGSVN